MDKINKLFSSRRFWAAVAAVAVIAAGDKTGFTPEQITQFVMAVGAWIFGESLRSTNQVLPPSPPAAQ